MTDLSSVAKTFEQFAEDCRDSSPLYERLSRAIMHDQELLELAGHAARRQPIPNMLFAAVRFLMLKGYGSGTLAEFESIDSFRSFCRAHSTEILKILETRRVQTNEVGRCSYLFPAFVRAATILGGQALALIEIGTSAGLLLNWDRYGYRYGNGTYGDPRSPVQLTCELRGTSAPPLSETMPAVSSKVGIDLHAIDTQDDDEGLWLRSLVWPEDVDRAEQLVAAMEVQRLYPVRLVNGDGLMLLPHTLSHVSDNSVPCVFHTAVLNQFSRENRSRFTNMLSSQGATRDLVWISAELGGQPSIVQIEITIWRRDKHEHHVLAYAHPHGRWLEWIQ